jgi:hypothetical protein
MKSLEGKSILFFSPQFFGYQIEIEKKMRAMGAAAQWFDDRPSNSFLSKVLIRINKKLLKEASLTYYENIIETLKHQKANFDYILFISPESITRASLEHFKSAFGSSKFILYMWDSFKNKQALDLLNLFDSVLSFDPTDCEKYKVKFRPLFYLDEYSVNGTEENHYDFLFIGTAHSDRYNFVKNLVKNFDDKARLKLFFYLSSKKLFLLKKLFDKDFRNVLYKDISFNSLTLKQNAELLKSSKIILDVNHPKQVGLTMRTIETLGAQKKLITTNSDIVNYDFYNQNSILVIDREKAVIPNGFLKLNVITVPPTLLHKYSIEGWIEEIFALKN